MSNPQPSIKPANPNFSSGPCAKRPGYDINQLDLSTLGRSHRSAIGKDALQKVITDTAEILQLPEGYRGRCLALSCLRFVTGNHSAEAC